MGLAREENLVVFRHMHATGSRETTHKEVENTRGSSPKPAVGNREHGGRDKEQASSSAPKVREQTDEKRSRSQEAGPATRANKIFCLWRQDVKSRRVISGIFPCVIIRSLETDAFIAIVASIDMLMARRSLARGRTKRVLKEQLRF